MWLGFVFMSRIKKTVGSILVVSTLILSILAGLSIATMQNVVREYQSSTEDQDKTLALQSAQYALAEAKRLLLTKWAPGAPPCASIAGCVNGSGVPVSTNGVAVWTYTAFAGSSDFALRPGSYFSSNAQVTPAVPNGKVSQRPRFFVVDLGCDPYSKVNIYPIIALGYGGSAKTTEPINHAFECAKQLYECTDHADLWGCGDGEWSAYTIQL